MAPTNAPEEAEEPLPPKKRRLRRASPGGDDSSTAKRHAGSSDSDKASRASRSDKDADESWLDLDLPASSVAGLPADSSQGGDALDTVTQLRELLNDQPDLLREFVSLLPTCLHQAQAPAQPAPAQPASLVSSAGSQ
ncbi:NAD-dependent histone deacetylase [Aureococcus anophagefferens]|nr:NAD-dependent histone deacetylase [Aureococcus anophagefferens]